VYARRRTLPLLTSVLVAATVGYGASAAVSIAGASLTHKRTATHPTLSGTWAGRYGGTYSGTFTLHWKQSGSALSGTIKLSAPSSTLDVNGTVHHGRIRFGTVGSTAITYSGSVSGKSMSGSYRAPGGGGSWSADKR